MKLPRAAFSALLFVATAGLACAHPGHGWFEGGSAGFLHPLSGWDHALAMIAVGLWAAQLGAPWLISGTFVVVMTAGAAFGHYVGPISGIEQGIAATVLALGLLVGGAIRLPVSLGVALVGLFAAFHGLAHGAEIPATAGGLAFGAGFIAATALLHGVGIAFSKVASGKFSMASRLAGAGVAIAGLALLLS